MLSGCDEDGFVAGAADLKEGLTLIFELDLLVVDLPRQEHEAVGGEKFVPGQSLVLAFPCSPAGGAHVRQGRPLHMTRNYGTIGKAMTTVRVHRWDEIALDKITEMISQKIIAGEREMLAQIYLKRGALVPMHAHESEQMTYILQGALKVSRRR